MDRAPEGFDWKEWDWRPLARLFLWVALAALWSRGLRGASWAAAVHAVRQSTLLILVTYGLVGQVLAFLSVGLLYVLLMFDEAVFSVAEWLVRPWVGVAFFGTRFAAAFCAEFALVLGSIELWRVFLR